MKIAEEVQGAVTIFRLEGRLDTMSSGQLESQISAIAGPEKNKIVLSLAHVDYLSSSGMRVLLAVSKKLKSLGGKLVVCGLTEEVLEIIKMAGFHQILHITADEANALKEF